MNPEKRTQESARKFSSTKMAKEKNGSVSERDESTGREERYSERKSKRKARDNSEVEFDEEEEVERKSEKGEKNKRELKRKSRRRYSSDSSSSSSGDRDLGDSFSESGSESSGEESDSEEERRRRRKRKERRRREEENERERRRRRDKEKKRRRREKEEEVKKKKKKDKDKGKKGAVTNSWGKYGIIRETDMWNKRPEFTAWLMEVKQVNLEHLPNWEEKQMFKQFMEDHNTATFPSKKYYNLDAYYRSRLEKEIKKGSKKVVEKERTVFDDEEQRRLELMREREKKKEEEVESLKRSMQSGMAQAMKEQALLREKMAYHYKLGNFEAAAAIQRRLDPDVPM